MNATDKFKAEFIKAFPKLHDARPFMCEGSPLDCTIFIVGFNPATTMYNDFWNYWSKGYGYQKTVWFEQYKSDRKKQKETTGNPHTAVSATRRNIDWLIEGGENSKFLETNIYTAPTATEAELSKDKRKSDIFEHLLAAIKPKLILTHGRTATEAVRRLNPDVALHDVRHLSRGWSRLRATELGRELHIMAQAG
jgi:uracil-DNA glycosylase